MKSKDNKTENILKDELENEMLAIWRKFEITAKHVVFLNQLNAFLSEAEEQIIVQAKAELLLIAQKLKDAAQPTSDFEIFADIGFFTEASDGDPIFTARHLFRLCNLVDNNWGLLCDEEDWRESGWLPQLEKRCCYLMHELAYHSGIMHQIFDVNSIWVDVKVWDQSGFLYENGEWQSQKKI